MCIKFKLPEFLSVPTHLPAGSTPKTLEGPDPCVPASLALSDAQWSSRFSRHISLDPQMVHFSLHAPPPWLQPPPPRQRHKCTHMITIVSTGVETQVMLGYICLHRRGGQSLHETLLPSPTQMPLQSIIHSSLQKLKVQAGTYVTGDFVVKNMQFLGFPF